MGSKAFPPSPVISRSRPDGARKTDGRGRRNGNGEVHRQQHFHALMLKAIIQIISTMADDPDKYRAGLKVKLLELADTMPLAAMAPTPPCSLSNLENAAVGTPVAERVKPISPALFPCSWLGQTFRVAAGHAVHR
jgi:hypothetical protein